MIRQIFLLIFLWNTVILSNSEVNLKCSSSRMEGYCLCHIKIDLETSLPVNAAVCDYLELEQIPNVASTEAINYLDLSHNNLKELRKDDMSDQLAEILFTLKLRHNQITDLDDNVFDAFSNLKSLDLSHNNIKTIPSKNIFSRLENLHELDLSFNELKDFQDDLFNNLKNLRKLDLSYNNLYNIPQDSAALLEKLGINENILHLAMDNVGITRIHEKYWINFKQIKHLSIADNPLDEIPQTAPSLEYLDISGTNITNLHENYLNYWNLKLLRMSRMNNLVSIPQYALFNLGNLEEFFLTDSPKIENLNEFVFGFMDKNTFPRKFRRFDVSRNKLSTLNDTFEYIFEEAELVDISFNPWQCNCDLLWLKKTDSPIQRRNDFRCASPDEVINKPVLELQPRDVPNCYPEIYGKKIHQTALLLLVMLVCALIVVIIYLCLYSPSWSIKITRTKVSPDSPYSINNEQM
ncbi:hypothetical protein HHI36_024063 [Cryptolaemus montrouzieri]|uniref:LRRCT domain-containing protein n=1 Tax=Cryptolaemus montrouzieri TaxID=559131 RepID=A0ABD2NCR5_9CUCU